MKLISDFFPILLFFLAYQLYGIYIATAVAIGASLLQLVYSWFTKRRLERMQLITFAMLAVFGGLTLLLQDPTFVMWKPSVLNWLFCVLLIGSQFIGKKNLIQRMMEGSIQLPRPIWLRLNLAWAFFFLFLGFANLYVANGFFTAEAQLTAASGLSPIDYNNCSGLFQGTQLDMCNTAHSLEERWVNFKLFGMLGLILVFAILQTLYLMRYIPDGPQKTAGQEEN